ncbi:Hypothetical protein A7982_04108 [Minicystis rosea]|nr:Hypothetical protein A7982_04108 [Minicystis rosea]
MPSDDVLHLLLARAGTNDPLLPEGLPLAAADAPEALEMLPNPPHGAGLEGVPSSTWGVIAPEGPTGDRLLALADRLIKAREAEQGRPAPIHRVPPSRGPMSLADALAWRTKHFDDGAGLGLDRASYQLVLGDLGDVPLAIQQVQSIDGYVGRLFFADEAGYDAYIDKVLRAQQAPRRGPGRVVLHTAHDGSRALELGLRGLTAPGEALLRAELAAGRLPASGIAAFASPSRPGKDVLLDRAAEPEPGVLFTMSHGLGLPIDGWSSPADQRARQGAMQLGIADTLTGDDLGAGPFMTDGLWFMFACFSAGTPDASVYAHWLARLVERDGPPRDLRRTLALDAPFIASLPQKVLANPEGPLAFIGHVDLAWTHSFRDDSDPEASRAGRFMRVLGSALAGDPVGVAFQRLTQLVREADTALLSLDARDVPTPILQDPAALERRRALLWMQRQDLGGFVLLGDPAVVLPVDPSRGNAPAPSDRLEHAIFEALLAEKPLAQIAEAHGIDPAALDALAARYRQAGRRAIGIDR